jgi:hypothetical protein
MLSSKPAVLRRRRFVSFAAGLVSAAAGLVSAGLGSFAAGLVCADAGVSFGAGTPLGCAALGLMDAPATASLDASIEAALTARLRLIVRS